MKITCVDVVKGCTKNGTPYVQGAFRGVGKSGFPFLFVANCPPDFNPLKEYEVRVIFSPKGNIILPY